MTNQVSEEYLRKHPNEIDHYLKKSFKTFSQDNGLSALISSIQMIAKVKGVATCAEVNDPRLDEVTMMLKAIGYRLNVEPIEMPVDG